MNDRLDKLVVDLLQGVALFAVTFCVIAASAQVLEAPTIDNPAGLENTLSLEAPTESEQVAYELLIDPRE